MIARATFEPASALGATRGLGVRRRGTGCAQRAAIGDLGVGHTTTFTGMLACCGAHVVACLALRNTSLAGAQFEARFADGTALRSVAGRPPAGNSRADHASVATCRCIVGFFARVAAAAKARRAGEQTLLTVTCRDTVRGIRARQTGGTTRSGAGARHTKAGAEILSVGTLVPAHLVGRDALVDAGALARDIASRAARIPITRRLSAHGGEARGTREAAVIGRLAVHALAIAAVFPIRTAVLTFRRRGERAIVDGRIRRAAHPWDANVTVAWVHRCGNVNAGIAGIHRRGNVCPGVDARDRGAGIRTTNRIPPEVGPAGPQGAHEHNRGEERCEAAHAQSIHGGQRCNIRHVGLSAVLTVKLRGSLANRRPLTGG